jgi:FG-GAP-like repeat
MGDLPARRVRGVWLVSLAVLALGTTAATAYLYLHRPAADSSDYPPPQRPYAVGIQIQYFCARCHEYPPADTFPRSAWKEEVEQAYRFFKESPLAGTMQPPPLEKVVKYYEDSAPLELPLPVLTRAPGPLPVRLQPAACPAPPQTPAPAVANVNLVHLFDERRLDVLACDLRAGLVMALSPYAPAPAWRVLGQVAHPAHAEVVDLDGDGVKDLLVANLGSPEPTDRRCGSVVWLRGGRDGRFTPVTLLEGVGRVADVQAADFRGVGKLDLVVAVFGWRRTGEVIYLENQTSDWSHPVFVPHVLDERHGAIHVPVGDLNGDGRPDFVALLSQEHETVVAFLNDGDGRFRKETIYTGPHPAYGSTGIQLVDLDGDGRLDVLYTNGDSMDKPHVLKPYHGVQWLENRGRFPFVHHPIAPLYGAHRAVAADFRGNGKLDIVAVSFLPAGAFPQRTERDLDAVVYLEQTAPGQFARHSLETGTCDHVTCAAGDVFGTGRIDLVTGQFGFTSSDRAITIWKNQGRSR